VSYQYQEENITKQGGRQQQQELIDGNKEGNFTKTNINIVFSTSDKEEKNRKLGSGQ
jgi:hypothetical protein